MVARIPTPDSLTGTVVRLDQFTNADADELACLILDPALHEQGFVMYDCPATPDEALQLVDVRSHDRHRDLLDPLRRVAHREGEP